MSDHLPECLSTKLRRAEAPMYGLFCICQDLRAFEKRLRREDLSLAASRKGGYNDALIDAREAVAEWIDKRRSHDFRTCDDRDHDCYLFRDALAAIDALQEGEK